MKVSFSPKCENCHFGFIFFCLFVCVIAFSILIYESAALGSVLIETMKELFVEFQTNSEHTLGLMETFFVVVSSHMTYDGLN